MANERGIIGRLWDLLKGSGGAGGSARSAPIKWFLLSDEQIQNNFEESALMPAGNPHQNATSFAARLCSSIGIQTAGRQTPAYYARPAAYLDDILKLCPEGVMSQNDAGVATFTTDFSYPASAKDTSWLNLKELDGEGTLATTGVAQNVQKQSRCKRHIGADGAIYEDLLTIYYRKEPVIGLILTVKKTGKKVFLCEKNMYAAPIKGTNDSQINKEVQRHLDEGFARDIMIDKVSIQTIEASNAKFAKRKETGSVGITMFKNPNDGLNMVRSRSPMNAADSRIPVSSENSGDVEERLQRLRTELAELEKEVRKEGKGNNGVSF